VVVVVVLLVDFRFAISDDVEFVWKAAALSP
jgi:hypothetical protein